MVSKKRFKDWKEATAGLLKLMKAPDGFSQGHVMEYFEAELKAGKARWTKPQFLDYSKKYLERKLPD